MQLAYLKNIMWCGDLMNRKKQLLELISASCRNLRTQELKKIRDYIKKIRDEYE